MTRILSQASAEGLAVNRRHALGAFAALAGGMAAGGAVAAVIEPAPSAMAKLIADWEAVQIHFTAVVKRQDEIERRHPDIRDRWPSVYTGITGSSFHQFGLGIDAEFGELATRLRHAFGEGPDVVRVVAALDDLRAVARASLDAAEAEYQAHLEAIGLAAVDREASVVAQAEEEAFDAILACETASAEDVALRSSFLLEFVTRWPGDPKVSQIREALTAPRAATLCG